MRAGRLVVAGAIALLSLHVFAVPVLAQPEPSRATGDPAVASDLDRGSGMALGMVAGAIVGVAICDRAQALSCAFWVGAAITFGAVLGAAATGEDDHAADCDRELLARTWTCVDPAGSSAWREPERVRPADGRPLRTEVRRLTMEPASRAGLYE